MYQTDITSHEKSVLQAQGIDSLQQGIWGEQEFGYNSDNLVIDQVIQHYHADLMANTPQLDALRLRKINIQYVEEFRLGYAGRTLGAELQSPKSLLGSQNRGHLQRLGLLKPSGHEFFHGAIVIPYQDDNGDVKGAYGRRPKRQSSPPKYHMYWNAQGVPLFNGSASRLPKTLVLNKSAIDALTLMSAGFDNVAGTMGVQGFNDAQLSAMVNGGVQEVYVAFDSAFNRLLDDAIPFKQSYGGVLHSQSQSWHRPLERLEQCISFYLDEQESTGKAPRTQNTARLHLERFMMFCNAQNVVQITDVSPSLVDRYSEFIQNEKNIFTGRTISKVTQTERMDAVNRMLSRLHYYGIISESLAFVSHEGMLQ